jgi:hypothetical protein
MARIYNRRTGAEILFDASSIGIILLPRPYGEDHPHILIELHGIDLKDHSHKCPECHELLKDLGTPTLDWYIEVDEKVYRLDLTLAGRSRNRKSPEFDLKDFFDGTRLKLRIDTDTVEGLQKELKESEKAENYEHCVYLRDRIGQLQAGDR